MNKKVSVVIPAYNEEKYIAFCLNAVFGQTYKNFEVIVVDNGSIDETVSIAKSYGAIVVEDDESSIAGLRNFGAYESSGDVLAFLDADCVPSIDWLKNAVNRLSDDSAGVVGCHCEPPLNASWVEQAWHVSKPSGLKKVRFLGTANFIVSRDTFDLVGGFNTDLRVGEDYEFCFKVSKIGLNIVSDDSISVIHNRGPNSLLARMKKEIWYGCETRNILKINKLYLPFIVSVIFLLLILSFVFLLFIGQYLFSLIAAILVGLLLIVSSFYRCHRAESYRYFMHLLPIYFFYFLGRSFSLVSFFKKT